MHLSLVDAPRGTRGQRLTDQLRHAVLSGALAADSSLPASRTLAADLGVSRGLIVDVYAQLVAEGYLATTPRGGTRVTAQRTLVAATADADKPIQVPRVAGHNPGQPDPALFPRRDWARALASAVARVPDGDLLYGDQRGSNELRTVLAAHLGRTRGIVTDAEHVMVVSGFAQTLACIAALLRRGEWPAAIAVEDPGSVGIVEEMRWWGIDVVRVPVDAEGIDVAALAKTAVRAVVVTPAHQYPTGVALGPTRRHALIEWARNCDGFIIEDDYDAEFRYDHQPLTSLHALDPTRVVAAGSVSKHLAPALRLGWLVAPTQLVAPLAEIKANMDLGTDVIAQLALADVIASGMLDRHLRRSRAAYRKRRDALAEVLAQSPVFEVSGIAAGLHVLIALPNGFDENALAAHARELGFAAQPLGRYRHQPGPPGIVLGYGALTPDAIRSRAAKLVKFAGRSRR